MGDFIKVGILFFIFAFCYGCSEDLKLTNAINDSNEINRKESFKKGSPVAPGYTYMSKDRSFARELESAILEVGDDRVDTPEGDAQKLYKIWATPTGVHVHLRLDSNIPMSELEHEFSKDLKRIMVLLSAPMKKNAKKTRGAVSFMGILDAPRNSNMAELPIVVVHINENVAKETDWNSVEPESIPEICRKDGGIFQIGM